MSLKRSRSFESPSEQPSKRKRVEEESRGDSDGDGGIEGQTRTIHHVDAPMDIYHTKTPITCRVDGTNLADQGYIGCAPDEIVATLTGTAELTKRRFCVNIYRDSTRFAIGRLNPNVLLDMRCYTSLRTVSHEHARISYQPEIKSFVLDNIGRNGTRVNGELIRSGQKRSFVPLAHNDVITIGGTDMHFRLVAAPK